MNLEGFYAKKCSKTYKKHVFYSTNKICFNGVTLYI